MNIENFGIGFIAMFIIMLLCAGLFYLFVSFVELEWAGIDWIALRAWLFLSVIGSSIMGVAFSNDT